MFYLFATAVVAMIGFAALLDAVCIYHLLQGHWDYLLSAIVLTAFLLWIAAMTIEDIVNAIKLAKRKKNDDRYNRN